MANHQITVRTVSGKEYEIHDNQINDFMVKFVQNKNAETFDMFLGDGKYITLFRNGIESVTVLPLRDKTQGKTEWYNAIFFDQPVNEYVTKEQEEALYNFAEVLRAEGKNPTSADHNWLVGAIIESMPPSRRGSYHKNDIIAAAQYYPVYCGKSSYNEMKFK